MPEFRQNPLTGAWVIIAPDRGKRPDAVTHDLAATSDASTSPHCPFCPGNERQTPPELYSVRTDRSAPDTPGWSLRVFLNRFPAVTLDGDGVPTPESIAFAPASEATSDARAGSVLMIRQGAVGQHEVLVESPDHSRHLALHDDRHVRLILDAMRHRFRVVAQARDVKYVCLFKNHGRAAGSTIEHPHLQLLATSVVPPLSMMMLQRQEAFAKEQGRSIFDAMLDEELELGRRIVAANDEFVALCPWASEVPYETWIVPREPIAFYSDVSDESLTLLATLLRDVMARLHQRLADPPYNLVVNSGPKTLRGEKSTRLFVQVLPRLTGLAGFELGSGMFINTVSPEDAAAELRATT